MMFTLKKKNPDNRYGESSQNTMENFFESICSEKADERMIDTLLNIDSLNGENEKKGERFEWFLYDLFKNSGYVVEKVSKVGSADDKIDLIVQIGSEKIAIQAKNYKLDGTYRVNKDVVMSLSGAIENRSDITAGAVITSNFFTQPAREWQEKINGKPIYLIDREKLYVLIAELYPQLLAKVYFDTDMKSIKRCKLCGSFIFKKWDNKTNRYFLGCLNAPVCSYREEIERYIPQEKHYGYSKYSYSKYKK